MHLRDFSASHREALFNALYAGSVSGGEWDQVFTLMRQGQQAAHRVALDELADQFTLGQNLVIDELRKGGQFLDWELQYMQLGMAVGDLSGIYQRLARHYQLVQDFLSELRRHLWLPLVLLLAVILGLPAWLYADGELGLFPALGNVVLALIPMVLMVTLVPVMLTAYRVGWVSPKIRALFYRLPGAGTLLANYQTYHYLKHLNMCLGAGFSLTQALKQAARRMPPTPVQPRFAEVSRAVEKGEKFSAALERSGILRGISLSAPRQGATALDVQQQLTESVYRDCLAYTVFWARFLPWLLLALVPLVIVVNALSL